MSLFKKKNKVSKKRKGIIVSESNVNLGINGFTRLKDNVLFLNSEGNCKVLQIESSVAREGKTTVACNLAVSLGFTEKKVLIVDLDFRRPRVHRHFNLGKEKGLAEYMKGELTKEEIIKKTTYENVDILTRGEEIYNSSIVLCSATFIDLIAQLRNNYDYIILDCPPVLQVSDYIHIAKVSDGVLLMVAHAKTTKAQIGETVKELNYKNIKILGTVFTMYNRATYKSYYHSYNSYEYGDNKEG